jgi:pilus assembly protein FimV
MKPTLTRTSTLYRSLYQAILALSTTVFAMGAVQAAGLGKMKVLSSLGAPFRAEVELTNLKPEEDVNLIARVAAPEIFKQAGIDYNPALLGIRANLVKEGNITTVVLSSNSTVSEPLLEMLLELNWQAGRLVRQYTVLLDPIASTPDAPIEQIQPAAPQLSAAPAPAAAAPVASMDAAPIAPIAQPVASAAVKIEKPKATTGNNQYDVQKGDTLFNIASRMNNAGDSAQVKSLMALLLKNNPDAFIGNNINKLKAGVVLNTGAPVAAKANNLLSAAAPSKGFSQYKQSAAKKTKSLAAGKDDAKSITSAVKADVKAPAMPSAQDQLKVAGNASVGNKAVSAASKSAEEALVKEKAIAQEKARIAELQKNIQKAVEIKNSTLAAAPTASASATATANKSAVPPPVAVVTTAPPTPVTPAPVAVATVVSVPAVPDASKAAASGTSDATVTQLNKPQITEPPKTVVKVPVQAAKPAVVVEEPSWYENIDPLTVGGVAGGAALLGGLLLYRRRQKQSPSGDFGDTVVNTNDGQGGLLTADGGQAIDTFNSVFVSGFSGVTVPMESAEVDPVAEADVYMQYGRDAHAEDILKDALKQNPGRNPVRLKLMELYASKQNTAALKAQFDIMSELTQKTGDDWAAAQEIMEATQPISSGADSDASGKNPVIASLIKSTGASGAMLPHINLSEPTMIGDIPSMNQPLIMPATIGPKFDSPINLATTALKMPNVEVKKVAEEIEFDIQTPTVFDAPSAKAAAALSSASKSTGDSMPAIAPLVKAPSSVIEFNVSKFDVNPPSVYDKASGDSSNSDLQAIETKFSLAQAYMDIGDKEGAKELLQEVLESGHQSLTSQAKALLARL